MRMMLVEDVPVARLIQAKLLGQYGHVDAAIDGSGALEFFETAMWCEAPYEVVWLDLALPDLHGIEVMQRLRELETENACAHAKVIIVTGSLDPADKLAAEELGAEGFLHKPLTLEMIQGELSRLGLIEEPV